MVKYSNNLHLHMIAARSRENERRHWIHPMVLLYVSSLFVEIRAASLLYVFTAARPMPPVQDKMRGVKEPCSTSLIR